jgi:HTH-type transcriptional regulator/antitoxin HipB
MRISSTRDLGLAVRDRRQQLGLSQKQLANLAGVSRLWVNELERGKPRAEVGLVLRTLRSLDLTVDLTSSGRSQPSQRGSDTIDLDELLAETRRDSK